jgi:hypothetical protein
MQKINKLNKTYQHFEFVRVEGFHMQDSANNFGGL